MRLPVTMTSDFICPWCYIGERKLLSAIERLPADVQVDISYRPFELNPDMPAEGRDRKEYRSAKFGSWAKSQALDAQVTDAGKAVGLTFNYGWVKRTPNTVLPHRLMWAVAYEGGDQAVLANRLFAAYFTDGLDLSDHAVLRRIAVEAGLSEARADEVLDGELGTAEVQALTGEAYAKGIHGVPLFEIGGQALSGAQPVEVMEAALRRAARLQAAAA